MGLFQTENQTLKRMSNWNPSCTGSPKRNQSEVHHKEIQEVIKIKGHSEENW